eukprot:gene36748-45333_t
MDTVQITASTEIILVVRGKYTILDMGEITNEIVIAICVLIIIAAMLHCHVKGEEVFAIVFAALPSTDHHDDQQHELDTNEILQQVRDQERLYSEEQKLEPLSPTVTQATLTRQLDEQSALVEQRNELQQQTLNRAQQILKAQQEQLVESEKIKKESENLALAAQSALTHHHAKQHHLSSLTKSLHTSDSLLSRCEVASTSSNLSETTTTTTTTPPPLTFPASQPASGIESPFGEANNNGGSESGSVTSGSPKKPSMAPTSATRMSIPPIPSIPSRVIVSSTPNATSLSQTLLFAPDILTNARTQLNTIENSLHRVS